MGQCSLLRQFKNTAETGDINVWPKNKNNREEQMDN